jgi:DNA-binding XRE family transcriptional regulator
MKKAAKKAVDHRAVELDGVRYVILRENVFRAICEKAGVSLGNPPSPNQDDPNDFNLDPLPLAKKLLERRKASGLSQAELARQAGVRIETLNRIERGKTTPDFTTIRKLVVAMNVAEQASAAEAISPSSSFKKRSV